MTMRHNFRGSRWHTAEQLADPELTQREGISASVMDYSPINLPAPGRAAPAPFQTTLGPYDYWAIEYGYMPCLRTTPRPWAKLPAAALIPPWPTPSPLEPMRINTWAWIPNR